MQQDAGDPLPVCDSEGHLLFCSLQSGGGEGRGQHQCQKDQQNNPQGWNHHCPESECGVREKQEVTEYKKNCRQPTSPAPFHTIEAAEPHLPQIYLTPLTQRTFQDISSTILHKSVQQLSFL